ncbi:MAG: YggS family pyridoxal phosphate-dependent enzyme [Candidatus Parabeggiatoa sp. nov. 1]|nr:MAG: YggS family pyridoxal phosphate-dependent enzyme [Gammaproteobacteria bacterium]
MISDALTTVRQRIAEAARQFARAPDSIQLLAVSKTRPVADIVTAIESGQRCFGESYLQEAISKIGALRNYPLQWHFIGPLQSNKTRLIAEHFDWVQSLDNEKHAVRLNAQRPTHLPPLNVCIQVNISNEPQKSGIRLTELPTLAQAIAELPRLRLRGLMALPAPCADFNQQRLPFRALHTAYQQLQASGLALDTLSMGMTNDLAAAIAEGATLVRIGTAIFGERERG